MLVRLNLGRSGPPWPPALLRSCARARRLGSRTPIPSHSAWPSLADQPQLLLNPRGLPALLQPPPQLIL